MAISSINDGSSTRIGGGIIAANFSTTPTGTYVENGISYKYLRFNASGSMTFIQGGIAEILVVGGGANGVYNDNGNVGGGGGGVRFGGFLVNATTYTVTVGASNGGSTSFGDILKVSGGEGPRSFRPDGGYHAWAGHSGGGGGGGVSLRTTIGWPTVNGGGAGGTLYGANAYSGVISNYTGTATEYGIGGFSGSGAANTGRGGLGGGTGGSGIVVVRVRN